jgi:hypothetical protein
MTRVISYEGLNGLTLPYKLANGTTTADEGKAVALTADSTVGVGTDGAALEGKLLKVEGDGVGTVQVGGVLNLPYKSGTVPTVGSKVVVDGAGNVKDYASDTIAHAMLGRGEVISVDTTNLRAKVRFPA